MLTRDQRLDLGFLISDTARILRREIDQRAAVLGLTRAQWVILAALKREEGRRQVDLATDLELEPITVARLVDKLEASGFVERRRDPADRRAHRLFLTPSAGPILSQIKDTADALMQGVLAGLDDSEIEGVTQALRHIRCQLLGRGPAARAADCATITKTELEEHDATAR